MPDTPRPPVTPSRPDAAAEAGRPGVRGYRAQHHVESAFRSMKNTLALQPHWTDQQIAVHVFCCVLALLLYSLLQREMHRRGLTKSAFELVDQLGRIREIGVPGKKPVARMTLSQMTDDQRALYEALDLKRYLLDLA